MNAIITIAADTLEMELARALGGLAEVVVAEAADGSALVTATVVGRVHRVFVLLSGEGEPVFWLHAFMAAGRCYDHASDAADALRVIVDARADPEAWSSTT